MTVDVAAGREIIIPEAIDFYFRGFKGNEHQRSTARRPAQEACGWRMIDVDLGECLQANWGTRRHSPHHERMVGLFSLFINSSQESSATALVLGLKSDVNNRSNVAVLHTGDGTSRTRSRWSSRC